MLLVDTWAWVELFRGTKAGEEVRKLLKENSPVSISLLSVAELSQWAAKENADKEMIFSHIRGIATFIELDFDTLSEAGGNYWKIRRIKKDIGMMDVIIYTSALIHGLEMLTGDSDFSGLPGIKMISK